MTVRLAMAYAEVDVARIEDYLDDRKHAIEQKVDGTRALVVITTQDGGEPFVRFLGRSGGLLKHTAAMQHFKAIEKALKPHFPHEGECVLDGEVMIDTGKFVIFDLPYLRIGEDEIVKPEMAYRERRQFLTSLTSFMADPIVRNNSAWLAEDKEDLVEAVRLGGGEGVMIKDLDSPYEPGKRVKHSVKAKFVKTADVVVTKSTRGRNEAGRETGGFTFGVYLPCNNTVFHGPSATETCPDCDRGLLFKTLGNCSAIGKPQVEIGDVIEVAYLYRAGNGGLVQPRMLRVREDKSPTDCTIDQFPVYSKAVLG